MLMAVAGCSGYGAGSGGPANPSAPAASY